MKLDACPACGGKGAFRELLRLTQEPIYLHPVAADAAVPQPHYLDLDYRQCLRCGHAFQTAYDLQLLANIYRSHYYTPAVVDVGAGFRQDFIDFLSSRLIPRGLKPRSMLEVGCSSGEMLAMTRDLLGLGYEGVLGIEPNHDTAEAARQRGLMIREEFFDARLAEELGGFDFVFSRHVIEHVEALPDFLRALRKAMNTDGWLVIETPSLDWALAQGNCSAFHIEHLHVFSLHSLAIAAQAAGLTLVDHRQTGFGNLIAMFRAAGPAKAVCATDTRTDLQAINDSQRRRAAQRLHGRPLLFWGAGSAARTLMQRAGRVPEVICDKNPGKIGKRFVGIDREIVYAPETVAAMIRRGEDRGFLLVAASAFETEILNEARQLGWRGETVGYSELA